MDLAGGPLFNLCVQGSTSFAVRSVRPHPDKSGGLNGSTQHSLEVLLAAVSKAKFVGER